MSYTPVGCDFTKPPFTPREYNEWFIAFIPQFDIQRGGKSTIVAILEESKEKAAWLDDDMTNTYLKHFRKNSPIANVMYEKVAIQGRPDKFVIRARQPRELTQ